MLSVLVWNSVRLINSSNAELLVRYTHEESRLLAYSLAPGLAANDRAMLKDALSLLQEKHDLVYIGVYDRNNQLMSHRGTIPTSFKADQDYADATRDGVFDLAQPIVLYGQYLGQLHVGYSIKGVQAITAKTRQQDTFIAVLGLTLSIGITVLLGLFLTKTLRQLEEGAKALSRGDHAYRIAINSRDEVGDVARAFNRLAEHLGTTRVALEQEHQALTRETAHLSNILNSIDAVIVEAAPDSRRFTYVSQEAQSLLGYPVEDWLTPGFWEAHILPADLRWLKPQVEKYQTRPGSYTLDYRMVHRDNHPVWVRSINAYDIGQDGTASYHGILFDITEQKQNEERIIYLANHDYLTGLFNRRRFQEELEHRINDVQRFGDQGALLFIDLDQFKYVNDTLGHQAGDEYLYNVSCALVNALRETDIIGRLGGDEFGVILPRSHLDNAQRVAANLLTTLSSLPVELGRHFTSVSASIGIVMFPTHGDLSSDLLAKADAAMYTAKDRGRNRAHTYSEGDEGLLAMHAKLKWEDRIHQALEQDRFILHYQPVVYLDTQTISHYEVLLRMLDEDDTLIPPNAFLDTAERFGLIRDIDHWVLRHSIQVQGESERTDSPITLAINISGRHFGNPEIMQLINAAIEEHGAEPQRLIFELTETAALENLAQARAFIDLLHDLGCHIALDDFGVGFSDFHYLKHLPVDMLKIDGSFVRNLDKDHFDRIFIRAMADLAQELNIITVAEFVENADIVTALRELHIELGQGFHLGRPQPYFLDGVIPQT